LGLLRNLINLNFLLVVLLAAIVISRSHCHCSCLLVVAAFQLCILRQMFLAWMLLVCLQIFMIDLNEYQRKCFEFVVATENLNATTMFSENIDKNATHNKQLIVQIDNIYVYSKNLQKKAHDNIYLFLGLFRNFINQNLF